MNFRTLAAVATLVVAGCSTTQKVQLSSNFDEKAVAHLLGPGPNQITGSALIRQGGGGVVTCAGGVVYLMPVTPYAKEWARYVYGSDLEGYHRTGGAGVEFTNLNLQFAGSVRMTNCNAQGFFAFNDVADGDFYVFTKINWRVGGDIQGGSLMKTASVRGGQKKEIVLAP